MRLVCPECANANVGSNDSILATARGHWYLENGARKFAPDGWTEVNWDSQEEIKPDNCFCEQCGWTGPSHKLVTR